MLKPANYSSLNPPPGFDFSKILPMLNDDDEQLRAVLRMFREDFADTARLITEKLAAGEHEQAEKLLHQTKGVAGNVGAVALYQLSQALDQQLKQNSYSTELLAQWQAQFAETLMALDGLTAERSTVANPDQETSRQLLLQLDNLLAQNDFISNDLLQGLRNSLDAGQQDTCGDLIACIKKLDYAAARVILSKFTQPPAQYT